VNPPSIIAFRVDYELRSKLEKSAKSENRSLSNYLRTILREHEQQQRMVAPPPQNQVD
jgi:hypothetical protein